MTTAFVGAGVVALGTATVMPDLPEPGNVALADAGVDGGLSADVAARAIAERASRSDGRGAAEVASSAEQVAPDVWVLPLRTYTLTSKFGARWGRMHAGIDLGAPEGTPFMAVARGRVILARSNGGYGLNVMLDHGNGIISVYGHASKLLVKEGQMVEAGDVIARVGNTGYSFGAHLHFEIRLGGKQTDPLPWLKAKGADVSNKSDVLTQG